MNQCNAKARSGKRCRLPVVKGKTKCRMHGGLSTGPKDAARPGNTNALKHGIYREVLPPEERSIYDATAVGTLDHEIKLAKWQLRNGLKAQLLSMDVEEESAERMVQGFVEDPSDFRLAEIKASTQENGESHASRAVVKKRPDYWALIDRLLGRIGRLEQQRAEMLNKGKLEITGKDGGPVAVSIAELMSATEA